MLSQIAVSGLFQQIWLAHMGSYRATSLEEMYQNLPKSFCEEVRTYDTVREAFDRIRNEKQRDERVYIVGSLYLVGEIKEYLNDD